MTLNMPTLLFQQLAMKSLQFLRRVCIFKNFKLEANS